MKYRFEIFHEFPTLYSISSQDFNHHLELVKKMENYGYTGSLIYFHHRTLDPWIISTMILQNTENHVPLMAIQPYYTSPLATAKLIRSIAQIYGRRVYLNLVTGQSQADLAEAGDPSDKHELYEKMKEFVTVLRSLLQCDEPFTYSGRYYSYDGLCAFSSVEAAMFPKIFVASGSGSEESIALANAFGDAILRIPVSFDDYSKNFAPKIGEHLETGIKFKLICRKSSDEAQETAAKDRADFIARSIKKNQIKHEVSFSVLEEKIFYPLTYTGDCPLLVGSYEEVASYLEQYLKLGTKSIIVSNIRSEEDLEHNAQVFRMLRSDNIPVVSSKNAC
ncbi:LLM class flavin-dependent oxidoreductase [Cohnella laeviribosi]|uniref:LLM class flavin-dependent oxidoreductase n=1 Tax=Cohnella laeviribosi TaxID=380174 RepID=UPI000365173A|nr:LLM class flavin-dependent oxidoreductase [Cohnella laeviribosi]